MLSVDDRRQTVKTIRYVAILALSCAALCGCSTPRDSRAPSPAPGSAAATPSPVAARPLPHAGPWANRWADGAVFYQIFVRSFADGDGDGIGDLKGLTARLDYLNDGNPATRTDLGVEGIWLMPVFESPSYHGYDVVDYETIEKDYGTNEDFRRFLDEAHRRGIRVIVDFVMNHTSAQHPWFQESSSSPSSPRRDWYVWRQDDPGWTQPWGTGRTWHEKDGAYYFGLFWGGMPDLNFRNPAVRDEIERLALVWLDRGVDGFRLDATRHLVEDGPGNGQCDSPETHAFLKEFSAVIRSKHPDALLVGENWTGTDAIAEYYGSVATIPGGDELPMSFDFPLAGSIVDGVKAGDGASIATKVEEILRTYPRGVLDGTFLTNHDMVRLATQLGGEPARLRSAAAILMTLPGTPFVYYGEEVGLENGKGGGDEAKRTPMPWDATAGGGFTTGQPWEPLAPGRETRNVAAESADPGSLLSRYRDLIHLRAATPALRTGSYKAQPGGMPASVLAFVREADGSRVLVAHNLGASAAEVAAIDLGQGASVAPLWTDPRAELAPAADGRYTLRLPPGASGVWATR